MFALNYKDFTLEEEAMYTWASCRDLQSSLYYDFCRRNSVISFEKDFTKNWEMAWAFYSSNPYNYSNILCMGKDGLFFKKCLLNEKVGNDIDFNIDFNEDFYCGRKYSLIYCFRVISLQHNKSQARIFQKLSELLLPGGRLILTVPYILHKNIKNEIKLKELLKVTDLIPYNYNKSEMATLNEQKDELIMKKNLLIHKRGSKRETLMGMILYKPYKKEDLIKKIFHLRKSWLHIWESKELPVEYMGIKNREDKVGLFKNIGYRIFWLPEDLLKKSHINIFDISKSYGTGLEDATRLTNELICKGLLV